MEREYSLIYVFGLKYPLTADLMRETLENFGFNVRVNTTELGHQVSILTCQLDNFRLVRRAYPQRFRNE